MRSLQNLSIRYKLVLIVTVTSTIVLFLSSTAFFLKETVSTRRESMAHMQSLAEIISANSRIPLQFHDPMATEEILEALKTEPDVRLAIIFNRNDYAEARYARPGENLVEDDNLSQEEIARLTQAIEKGTQAYVFQAFQLDLVVPILDRGKKLGAVYLQSDLRSYRKNLAQLVAGAAAILSISILLAFLLAFRLKRWISRPLLQLVDSMRDVSETKDFSLRATKETPDEIGMLVDGFNQMLAGLEARDTQLQRYHRDLEKTIASRTLELKETNVRLQEAVTDLEKAKRAAESASEAKSLFLANMSHEIRTPMVGVLGMTELLLKSQLSDRQKSMAKTVYSSGEALLSILNDILDFSKIESGKLELEQIPFDLWETVEDVLELMAEKAFAKEVELICRIDPDLPRTWVGDPKRLRQIVLNLVSNAIKFTEEGEVNVKVGRQEALLTLEVQDTGIGIDPEAQERIFDSFSQADNTTSRHFGGTGLGLAIVKQLTELMGGSIQLHSTPEKGTSFICTLRLLLQEEQPSRFRPLSFFGEAVIADPNASCREMLMEQLNSFAIHAEGVPDGRTALTRLKKRAGGNLPLLFIVSSSLPDLDASGLLKEMGRIPELERVRILLLSHPSEEQGQLMDPAPPLLYKPVRPSQLEERLHQIGCGTSLSAVTVQEVDTAPFSQGSFFPGRILIAEDNPSTVRLIRLLLEGTSEFQIDVASTGSETIELCRNHEYALILMDCQMPTMDGYEATRRLRREGFSMPIIALTANNSPEDRDACQAAGMDDFLCKPFKSDQLKGMLEHWIPNEKKALA